MPAKTSQHTSSRSSGSRPASRRSSSRTSSGRRASASRTRGSRSGRPASAGLLAGCAELFHLTYFGRVILVLLFAGLLVLLNILLSRNQSELFFRLSGIEMILAAVIFWLLFLLKKQ